MRTLKISLATVLALGGLLACASLVQAQDTNAAKKGPRGQMGARMAEELNLDDAQKAKVQEAFQEQGKKMRELRDDTSLTQEQRQEKMKAMREDMDKKMKTILKPDQYEKWQKSREQMRGQRGDQPGKKKGQEKKD